MIWHMLWTMAAMGGVLMSLIYLFQDRILYVSGAPPDARTTLIRPERFNIRDHEDLYIPTPDDEMLNCWFFKVEENYRQAPTMLYFHGNAGSILKHPTTLSPHRFATPSPALFGARFSTFSNPLILFPLSFP